MGKLQDSIRLLLHSMILLLFVDPLCSAAPLPEEKIKAGYIYQFTQFVTWPDSTPSTNKKFIICVLGKDPIGNELDPLHSNSTSEYIFVVRKSETAEKIDDCNILYISNFVEIKLSKILQRIKNKPVLTVSSQPDFVRKGGIIGFVNNNNKIRLEINRLPAKRMNIEINTKLLEVAILVLNSHSGDEHP